jgi:hypothetical protein
MKTNLMILLAATWLSIAAVAQQPAQTADALQQAVAVPRLVNFNGKTTDAQGKPMAGIAGATFSIYKDQYQGAPLWMETQNIQADAKGNYTVQLGANSPAGLPLELFMAGEARWLGVRIGGGEEQSRLLLLSVPYALKAADAETLGGKPLSAFQLAPQSGSGDAQFAGVQPQNAKAQVANTITCASGSGCKKNSVPIFNSNGGAATVTDSIVSQSGSAILVAGKVTATGVVSASSFDIGGNPFGFGSYTNQNIFLGFAGNSGGGFSDNTGTGFESLLEIQSGLQNSAYGALAMIKDTTGSFNTSTGFNSLPANQSGSYNTVDGTEGLPGNVSGSYNTAIGGYAGQGVVTGSSNTFLGYGTTGASTLTNAVAIGANSSVQESNAMILGGTGNSAVTVGIGTPSPYYDYGLTVTTGGQNGNINGGVVVNATGGNLYLGMTSGTHKFRVDTNGVTYADGGFQSSGADFAESLSVRGQRSEYEPGDVLEIDQKANRNLALSHHPYATLVAGIYSTKPGLLASPHTIDDPAVKSSEVPLAVVGIVPCKVTSENGPIARGDLLVTSSRPGYAMRGTDRRRMLGAVVGKALEPMPRGNGVIQVLVTLQ